MKGRTRNIDFWILDRMHGGHSPVPRSPFTARRAFILPRSARVSIGVGGSPLSQEYKKAFPHTTSRKGLIISGRINCRQAASLFT
jgi:hypothetical protein